jgi:hypothetical protein
MRKVIVTTTINGPTEAIEKFDLMPDWTLVVIGDKKTPENYKLKRGLYLAPSDQDAYDLELSKAIGWNCIQRRNFGFLVARDLKADIIAVVDDDNIPMEDWGKNLYVGKEIETNYYQTDMQVFDPVGCTNYPQLWHRGFPLQLLTMRNYDNRSKKLIYCDIQADFWNGDPDIDAICRMEHAPECTFDVDYFPISSNKLSPFNSQNTFLSSHVLEHFFLFPRIGRMDDIWASYYVQSRGFKVVYGKPSVFQQRNLHDLTKDMQQEYLGYETNLKLANDLMLDPMLIAKYLPIESLKAWELYKRHF